MCFKTEPPLKPSPSHCGWCHLNPDLGLAPSILFIRGDHLEIRVRIIYNPWVRVDDDDDASVVWFRAGSGLTDDFFCDIVQGRHFKFLKSLWDLLLIQLFTNMVRNGKVEWLVKVFVSLGQAWVVSLIASLIILFYLMFWCSSGQAYCHCFRKPKATIWAARAIHHMEANSFHPRHQLIFGWWWLAENLDVDLRFASLAFFDMNVLRMQTEIFKFRYPELI